VVHVMLTTAATKILRIEHLPTSRSPSVEETQQARSSRPNRSGSSFNLVLFSEGDCRVQRSALDATAHSARRVRPERGYASPAPSALLIPLNSSSSSTDWKHPEI
jgi:hypothetical protein